MNATYLPAFVPSLVSPVEALGLTKIDVAEAHLRTGVRLFLSDAHPVPIYTLASSAREILTALGEKLGVRTVLHGFAEDRGITVHEAVGKAHEYANFLKHADRDPTAVLKLEPDAVPTLLFIAGHDFASVTGGMPIELQVFEAWYFAAMIKRVSAFTLPRQEKIRECIRAFPPGFRTAALINQKRIGLETLNRYQDDPAMRMEVKRIVELPEQ
jgi:hypothetical protein